MAFDDNEDFATMFSLSRTRQTGEKREREKGAVSPHALENSQWILLGFGNRVGGLDVFFFLGNFSQSALSFSVRDATESHN